MATKKETTKKTDTNKKESTKKVSTKKKTTKKVEKTVNIDEKQFNDIVKNELKSLEEPAADNWNELEKYKTSDGEYDLTNASDEEVEKAFNSLEAEDNIYIVNGDPAVLTPKEEPKVKEPKVEVKKENKPKMTKKINKLFTYFWNGQMIDF